MPTNVTDNIYSTEYEDSGHLIPSEKIGYDNTESGLEATTVQDAIDELDGKIKASDEASEITYDNTDSGLTATNVQSAIDEVNTASETISEDLERVFVYGAGYQPSFLNGARLQEKTILELFTAMPYTHEVGHTSVARGSSIRIGIFTSNTLALFNDLKTLTGYNDSGYLEITKYDANRGIVHYNIGSKIFNCRIYDGALQTCYSMDMTALT